MNAGGDAGVSVIIPTYNHAHFLAGAIDSALAQSCRPRQIIVVDDGSTDDPDAVVAHYPGVRLIRQSNRGLAGARNTGLRVSSTPFLLFLDADDRLKEDAIRCGLSLLIENPDAAFAYGAYEICTGRGVSPVAFHPAPRDSFASFLRENLIGMHATVLYRRGPLEEVGGFREALGACEDYDLYLRLAHRFPVVCGSDVLAEYWHHGGNMSGNSAMMLRWALAVLHERRGDAERAGALADYRFGVRQWKQHYSQVWVGAIGRSPCDARLLRQGFAIFRMAPRQLAGALWRGVRRRIQR
jgi:glycosyltransferase involved in cell wall biosynthesis